MYFSLRKCNNFPIVSDRKSAALLQFYQPGTNTSLCTTRLQWSSFYYFSNFVKIISFLTLPDSFISTLFRAPLWWTGVLCPKFSLTEDFLAELLPIRRSKKNQDCVRIILFFRVIFNQVFSFNTHLRARTMLTNNRTISLIMSKRFQKLSKSSEKDWVIQGSWLGLTFS